VHNTSFLTYDILQSLITSKTYIKCHIPIFNPDLRIELAIPPPIKNGTQKNRAYDATVDFWIWITQPDSILGCYL